MVYPGFGKDSGPGTAPRPENPDVHFPQPVSVSPPLPRLLAESRMGLGDFNASSSQNFDSQAYQRPPGPLPRVASSYPRSSTPVKTAVVQDLKQIRSPHMFRSDEISKNSRIFKESYSDFPPSDKGYSVPYRARSPSLDFEKNVYSGDQHPHNQLMPRSISPMWVNQSVSQDNITSLSDKEITSSVLTVDGTYLSGRLFHTQGVEVPVPKRTKSPTFTTTRGASPQYMSFASDSHKRSPIDYRDLDAPNEMPSPHLDSESSFPMRDSSRLFTETEMPVLSSPLRSNQLNSSRNDNIPQSEESIHQLSTPEGSHQVGQTLRSKHSDVLLPKRSRSAISLFTSDPSPSNPIFAPNDHERARDSQSHIESSKSGRTNSFGATTSQPLNFPSVKRAKFPLLPTSDHFIHENVDSAKEIERELQSKAKRLARFKDELNQSMQSTTNVRDQKFPSKKQYQPALEKLKPSEDTTVDAATDLIDRNVIADFEGMTSSSIIVGLCPDMCPETERSERERKGDLDHYERLDGDRNLSSKFLAVKKYTRTAEREAELIRPMPILQKTMDYLLNLLDQPHDERFLGLYNFLWDRMRAIRMDLRMQHIFDLKAINMLEKMIRLHILAMHELCEYPKGEGFSEGFDAHLNIEQMNKTSVELFQLYDDHRKKGIHVPSEREFRGYYALLKLDKHPGYKVEPAELSLDLAKMTSDMRQSPEVLFARDVARACRTGNFIAFFRLAHGATYLQACLMHAHFSKLRTQAIASLHSGLQINQGIPVHQVAKWLGMEEENMENLLEYYGFSVKNFEEPYMVKENAVINVDNDYPIKCSKLVSNKRSKVIVCDVSSPSPAKSYATKDLKEFQLIGAPEHKSKPSKIVVPGSITEPRDQEMLDSETSLSPIGDKDKPMHKLSIDILSRDEQRTIFESQVVPANPLASFSSNTSENYRIKSGNEQKPVYNPVFRNSFGRMIKPDLEVPTPIMTEHDEAKNLAILPVDSVVSTPTPHAMFKHMEDGDQTSVMEEHISDDAEASSYDKEVTEAKLKLILRIWKRSTAKKKELREHKRAEANAALSSLSFGPPIWQYEAQSDVYVMFDIDRITRMRHEIQGRSWSLLNPSKVVAAKLSEKNPGAKCLCWKMVLCSLDETAYKDNTSQMNEIVRSAAGSWLHSKFMTASNDGDGDLLVSSPDLVIWKSWIPCPSAADQICCLSVIKNVTFQDLGNAMTGASAVLFLLSENISLELQKSVLHDLVMLLPSGSCLPLLILSETGMDELDSSTIARDLGLHHLDRSRVCIYSISFLKYQQTKQLDGFFSDECLRRGLEWLASESPRQIGIRSIKTRELVISQLKSTLETVNERNVYTVGPNLCILAFNEALDRSMESVTSAALANPTCWPCPEIDLLEESSIEHQSVSWYLPTRGWSTHARTEKIASALNNSRLPMWEDDLSWLSRGFNAGDDVENQKALLENCLTTYLTEHSQMMGVGLAKKEASTIIQKCARLELHNSTYYIIPAWVKIFQRIFSWQLMNLMAGEVSSTHVLVQHDISPNSEILDISESEVHTLMSPSYIDYPSFDELVEVGFKTLDLVPVLPGQHQPFKPESSMASVEDNGPTFSEDAIFTENEKRRFQNETMVTNHDLSTIANNGDELLPSRPVRTADRLSELLEKCNIIQNEIDKKLSIYF